jgi:hypothetical protein
MDFDGDASGMAGIPASEPSAVYGGSSGKSGRSVAAKKKPKRRRSKRKAEEKLQVFAKPAEVMSRASGKDAVSMSGAVRDMKEAQGSRDYEDEASGIRYAGGRAFKFRNGKWIDLKYKGSMRLLKIKYLGKAYMKLARKSSMFKKVLSLGKRLIVVVGKGRAIEVTPTGSDDVSDNELNKFLK